eukprot:TRINITY_DN6718_c0_g1_i1.p2 TRINITY_DN6718_c0_g1~~TRINITY_DN6718_c0_g1_i1.p2  ORF type:complete len:107 (-),score=3.45 TRINITY_DN6718_c0_g1_i1:97-417(-)
MQHERTFFPLHLQWKHEKCAVKFLQVRIIVVIFLLETYSSESFEHGKFAGEKTLITMSDVRTGAGLTVCGIQLLNLTDRAMVSGPWTPMLRGSVPLDKRQCSFCSN